MINKSNPIYIVTIILVIISFYFFRWSHQQTEIKMEKAVQSLLRNESLVANSYALSKSMIDLEKMEIIKCSELVEGFAEKRVFHSTLNQSYCYQNKILRRASEFNFDSTAINGLNYKITLQLNIQWQSLILELLIDFLLLFGSFKVDRILRKQEEANIARNKAMEIEKQILLDAQMQIRHDVASPIAAMKSVLDLLSSIDPKLKKIFTLSIDRTQDIFNQLSDSSKSLQLHDCDIDSIIQDVLVEKELTFNKNLTLLYNPATTEEVYVLANEIEFKRLLSNILNNSSEALVDRPIKKIEIITAAFENYVEIKIVDTGKGIPQNIIDKVGLRGESFGKENHKISGSGLGLFHAINTIKSWGGKLSITSELEKGTTVVIQIPIGTKITTIPANYILIDDDELVRLTWESKAKKNNIALTTYKSMEEFNLNKANIAKDTKIFIDSDLGNGVKGETLAITLNSEGFTNISMATGYEKNAFNHMTFLKGVITKTAPF